MQRIEQVMAELAERHLAREPLVFVDGGARHGLTDLPNLAGAGMTIGFEPSPQSWHLVGDISTTPDWRDVTQGECRVYPFAIAEHGGNATLHLSRRHGATSLLRPNAAYLSRFAADHWAELADVVEAIEVPTVRLDQVLEDAEIDYVDFLKLDIQGSELAALRSLGDRIAGVQVVKAEVNFVPIYENMPLAAEVMGFLDGAGFEFIDLQIAEACRRFHIFPDLYGGHIRYRAVWGDVIYARQPEDRSSLRAFAQSLVLADLGYIDLAVYQLQDNEVLESEERENFLALLRAPRTATVGARLRYIARRVLGPMLGRPMPNKQVLSSLP